MQRKVLAGIIALLSVTSLSVVYAFTVSKQLGANLTVTDPIQVFSDSSCTTTPYGTTLSLGSAVAGGGTFISGIYIKNAGPQSLTVYWNSTKPNTSSPGSTGISNTWEWGSFHSSLNGTSIAAGGCLGTAFYVWVGTGVPAGSYSWTVWIGHL